MVKYSPAQKRAVEKYRHNTVDRIELNVPAGRKQVYQDVATAAGMSLNQFIVNCIEKALEHPEND